MPLAICGPFEKRKTLPICGNKGITRLAIVQNKALNVTISDPLWQEAYIPSLKGMKSELVVPLRVRGKPVGVINLESPQPNAFDTDDEEIIEILADKAIIVIQTTKLINGLREIGIAGFNKGKDDFLRLILLRAAELIGADICAFWGYNNNLEKFSFETSLGNNERLWDIENEFDFSDSILGEIVKKRKIEMLSFEKAMQDRKYRQIHLLKIKKLDLKSVITAPFFSCDDLMGVLILYTSEKLVLNKWKDSLEKNLLELFTTQAAILLQYQLVNKELKETVHISIFNYIQNMIRLITHRLNNSVGNIRADILDLLEDKKKFDDETKEYFKGILEEANKAFNVPKELDRFISNLKSEKTKVTVFDIINEIVSEEEFKGIEIEYESLKKLPKVHANYGILKEVIKELFKNACKAMPKGGEISATGKELDNNRVQILVKDTGCGIPQDLLVEVFNYGYSNWDGEKGSGDGLPIIKKIIELDHEGKIRVYSKLDQGTIFNIELPMDKRYRR